MRGAGKECGGDTCEVALGELVVGAVGDQQRETLGWEGRRNNEYCLQDILAYTQQWQHGMYTGHALMIRVSVVGCDSAAAAKVRVRCSSLTTAPSVEEYGVNGWEGRGLWWVREQSRSVTFTTENRFTCHLWLPGTVWIPLTWHTVRTQLLPGTARVNRRKE